MILDEISRKILRIIQDDADISVLELADKVGLSQTPVWQRLKQMRKAGVIQKNVAIVDGGTVGMGVTVICFIKLNSHKEPDIEDFTRSVQKIEEVVQCFSIAGESDFLLRAVASDIQNYDKVVKPKILKLPWIGSLNTNFILSEIKNTTVIPV